MSAVRIIPDPPASAIEWHRVGRERLESDTGRFDLILCPEGTISAYDWETGLRLFNADIERATRWCAKRLLRQPAGVSR